MFEEMNSQKGEIIDEWSRLGDNQHILNITSMSQLTTKLVKQIDARTLLLKTLEVCVLFGKKDEVFYLGSVHPRKSLRA